MAATSNLDRYRRLAPLGAGGMSTVELAEDTVLGRRVALKRLHQDENVRGRPARLRREALIGASLTHPNLVSIFDILTSEDGDDVIVMEYVEGGTLADLLRQGKPDTATAMRVLTGVAGALDAIHAERIVHRDVKPGNILLGIDGSVKLADLGIAAVPDRTRITTDGAVLGTFSYMAPEQLEGSRATPAVDVYALAAVAFEVLSGHRAHTESNPVALAHAISTQPPPDLRSAWPEAPAAAADVLRRAMARDPKDRPKSAGELTGRLQAALEPQTTARIKPRAAVVDKPTRPRPSVAPAAAAPAPARQATRPPRVPPPAPDGQRRSRGIALVLAALVVAAIAVAIVLGVSSGGSHTSGQAATGKRASATSHSGSARSTNASSTNSSSANSSSTDSSSASSVAPSSAAQTGGAGSPVSAVETFYHLAAAHQYSSAWALADPAFRSQLGGYQSFEGGQAGDRSITFNSAGVTNQSGTTASVYVTTTSVRDDGTQHCSGPVSLIHGSSGWLLDHIDINC